MSSSFASPSAERDYIVQQATLYGVDPEAALAVATHEGVTLPAEVGDYGTSFGPWQLHEGGALPSGIANPQAWADSPAGIDYTLRAIARVAKGERGYQAVSDIVYNFEHPADPASEAANAWATYQTGGGPGLTGVAPQLNLGGANDSASNVPVGFLQDFGGGFLQGIEGPFGVISGVFGSAFDSITDPVEKGLVRLAFILGGFLLALVGLWIIIDSFGIGVPSPGMFSGLGATTKSRANNAGESSEENKPLGQRSARARREAGFESAAELDRKERLAARKARALSARQSSEVPF